MQTNPSVEQNNNIKWTEGPWNQSGKKEKKSMEERISQTATSYVQNEKLNES